MSTYSDYPPSDGENQTDSGRWDLIFEKRAHNTLVIVRRAGNPQGYITIFESEKILWQKIGDQILELQSKL